MRALLLDAPGAVLRVGEMPIPRPGPGEALVRVEACGVGLTVVNMTEGRMRESMPLVPLIPGHEVAGVVADLGAGVEGPAPGTRVVTSFYLTCGACRFCQAGREPLCERFRGNVGLEAHGGFAEYLVVPAVNALRIPDGISFVDATTIPDAIGTPFHVCHTRAAIRPGQRVVVTGAAGGVGAHMVQMARLCGAEVFAVDIDDEKLARLRELGADHLVNLADPAMAAEQVQAATGGRGVDVAIDLVGERDVLAWCVGQLDRGGALVNLTQHRRLEELPVAQRALVARELTVMGSRYVARWELRRAIQLVASGRIRPVVSEVVPLEGVNDVFARLRANRLFGRAATLPALAPETASSAG